VSHAKQVAPPHASRPLEQASPLRPQGKVAAERANTAGFPQQPHSLQERRQRRLAGVLRNPPGNPSRRTAASDAARNKGAERRPCCSIHSHSIINSSRKSAWLKGFALIDIGRYRRFYRQKNRSFAGAGLRGIGSSSISA